jgi:hypothetical protein
MLGFARTSPKEGIIDCTRFCQRRGLRGRGGNCLEVHTQLIWRLYVACVLRVRVESSTRVSYPTASSVHVTIIGKTTVSRKNSSTPLHPDTSRTYSPAERRSQCSRRKKQENGRGGAWEEVGYGQVVLFPGVATTLRLCRVVQIT